MNNIIKIRKCVTGILKEVYSTYMQIAVSVIVIDALHYGLLFWNKKAIVAWDNGEKVRDWSFSSTGVGPNQMTGEFAHRRCNAFEIENTNFGSILDLAAVRVGGNR
jgi:hypothetical protein